ncbi:MAG: hypothetical protein JWO46_231 [Nocardioidaceae bacterium]|nr:hypothetical protein [Nocardioidaceae bacterium]
MAKKDPKVDPKTGEKKPGRIAQIRQTYQITKKTDPQIPWILLGWFVGGLALGFAVTYLITGLLIYGIIIGVLVGFLAALIIFGRRGQRSAISQIEGKPGAAAAVLGMLRRGWKIEPGIAFNKQQDVVHRVVGPPGIVLIGEGSPTRLKTLLASERRKHERVASETTLSEVVVGDGPDQVNIHKLVRHVSKLKKTLKPAEMTDVLARLKALDANRSNIPLPKGPVPTSMKGMRQNMKGR